MNHRLKPCVALLTATACACAHAPTGPVTAPARDSLAEYLRTSSAVRQIVEAAGTEGLLSSAEPDIDDLETAAEALGITTIDELDTHVQRVVDDSAVLFAAFDKRRRGSRSGDTAHWVAVALLALDRRAPAEAHFRSEIDWESDYIDDVFALRRMRERGRLVEAALGDTDRQPITEEIVVVPEIDPEQRPTVRARRSTGYWPVFTEPGSRTIGGTIALTRNEYLEWDELWVLVRRPGTVRVLKAPVDPLPRLRLSDDGELTANGTIELVEGQRMSLLATIPGEVNLAMTEPGVVVELPWDSVCCRFEESADSEWWVRLTGGEIPGAWVLASTDAFRLGYPALDARRRAERAARPVRPRLNLGRLDRRGTLDVSGVELIYWLEGSNADARPLLVLHGGPGLGSRYLRAPLTATLGDHRVLVFYDQRGSGYSEGADAPDELTIDRFVADVDAVRAAAGVASIDILGHSFGGLLALHYALAHPDRVGHLVLVDPDPPSRPLWETYKQRLETRTAPEEAATMASIVAQPDWGSNPEATEAWFAIRMRAYVSDPDRAAYINMPFDEMTLNNYTITYPAIRENLGEWDLHDKLAGVIAPTLIVAGSDSIFPPEAMQSLDDVLSDSRLVFLENVGHFPFIEAPEAFRRLVVPFLER